jgi:hypothetical protein
MENDCEQSIDYKVQGPSLRSFFVFKILPEGTGENRGIFKSW